MSERGPLDFAGLRKSAEFAEEQARIADAGPLPVVPVHWAEHYAKDVRRLCDALEKAERERERLKDQEHRKRRAYEEWVDDAVWLRDELEAEPDEAAQREILSIDKRRLGALIDAFDEDEDAVEGAASPPAKLRGVTEAEEGKG